MRFAREKMRVQIRNSDVPRHIKPHLNLVFRKKMARIQAAGVNGFVNGFMHKVLKPDARSKATCDETELITVMELRQENQR